MKLKTTSPWISTPEAEKLLYTSREVVSRLVSNGLIGTRQLPGCRIALSRADVHALAKSYVKPATVRPPQESKQCQLIAM